MLKYELKKLIGVRYIWIFLAVLLLLNGALCLYETQTGGSAVPKEIVEEFFDRYLAAPDEIEAAYKARKQQENEQLALRMEARRNGLYDWEPDPIPNKYTDSELYNDMQLFTEVFGRIDAIRNYPSTLQKVIDRANANLTEFASMGISSDAYTYQYQQRVIQLYEIAQDEVRIGVEYTRGWGDYFSYDAVNIFIFAMLIVTGTVVFAQEKNSGFMPIIRVSRRGRTRTALAKIGAMLLVTVGIVLLFTLETWMLFGLRLGYSSPYNAIQAFDAYTLSPYVITVGQYFAITIAVKLGVYLLFSALMLAVSVFIYNYALIYLYGLGFFGVNFLLYTLRFINGDNPFKNLNFVAVSAVNPLFVRYRSVHFFGMVVGYVPFMCAVFSVLFLAACVLTVWKYNRGGNAVNIRGAERPVSEIRRIKHTLQLKKELRQREYSGSLILAEGYKTLISSRFVLVLAALFLVKCGMSCQEYQPVSSYSDAVYKEYMTVLAGEMTDEKRQYIADERSRINDTISRQNLMQTAYKNGEIPFSEYREFLSEYNYALSRTEYFRVIEDHADYIDQTEGRAWFVYDTGWKTLFFTGFDWTLYGALLLLYAGIFASEYDSLSSSGSFAQILRTSKFGRRRTFRSKLLSASAASVFLSVLWNLIDVILVFRSCEMPLSDAPLISIEVFGSTNSGLTIGQYAAVMFAMRIFASLVFTGLVCGLSCVLKRSISVMTVAVVLTLFPALLDYFGLTVFRIMDFTRFIRVTPMILGGTVILYTGFIVIVCIGLTIWAYNNWEKR